MDATVIIIGAGFAGLQAVKALCGRSSLRILLIDKNPYTVMLPVLPDVAAGFMEESLSRYPVARLVNGTVALITETVRSISLAGKKVTTDNNVYRYDYLIITSGSTPSPPKLPDGLPRYFGQLGSLDDAIRIQRQFHAYLKNTPHPHLLCAGTGYTGIELAVCLKARSIELGKETAVTMVDPAKQILPFLNLSERTYVAGFLASLDFTVLTGVSVSSADAAGATLSNGRVVPAPFLLWSSGSSFSIPSISDSVEQTGDGRIAVDRFLQVKGHRDVFAAGDACAFFGDGKTPLRKAVHYACGSGRRAGANCCRLIKGKPLLPFSPFDAGWVLPLHECGVGRLFNRITLKGTLPLRLHYFMCGVRNHGANRLKTALVAVTLLKRKKAA
ncbi:MAG: FAD-dependent oxidoreductase [Chitinispirillaceae bacterium]|nr:FAD-dependent oxidoreductase [Chitinispirillaceae bacterium]